MAKNLKEMTRKDRVLVSIECDSFFLSTNKTKKAQPVFNKLKGITKLPKRFDNELWMIVTMIGKALVSGCRGSQLTLSAGNYTLVNKERDNNLDHRRVRKVLDVLEDKGYLNFYIGYKDLREDISIMSCVLFSDKLISIFPESLVRSYGRNITLDEMVEIKDTKTKLPITKLTRFKGVGKNKKFMFEYNALLQLHDIRLGTRKCFVQYKQIFADDLEGAGRIYSFGSFQTMQSHLREIITIDGQSCTEVDIKANHISMMYLLEGIRLEKDFDCYHINLQEYIYPDIRNLCKMAVMCMINCKSSVGAAKALKKIVYDDSKDKEPYLSPFHNEGDTFYRAVVNLLTKKHDRLEFFKRGEVLWKKLQRLDSRIMEGVLSHFTEKGEVVLGWHDSWVVRKPLKDELVEVIKDSWFKVFGTYNNCFIKIEF
ncbi:hypothetical protein [Vibrio phage S4-7]|nr:hypothetical protein [Vibrio phage S4-7]